MVMNNWKKIFLIIWSGQAFSLVSSAIVQFAIIWWITVQTGSASVLAFAAIAGMLPQALLGPFIGVWVDRWNRKKIMILADSFIALCSALAGLLYYLNVIEMWHIYALLALRSTGGAFHFPAMQASVPLLAPEEQLPRIAGINQMLQSGANIAGPALGAIFMSVFSMEMVMFVDVIGAAIACTSLVFVKIPQPPKVEQAGNSSVLEDLRTAFLAIHANKGLFRLMIIWAVCVFIMIPVATMFPLLVFSHFKGGAFEQGMVEVAFGAGMLAGSILIGIWGMKYRKVLLINGSYMVMGLMMFLMGILSPHQFYYMIGLSCLFGLATPYLNSPFMVLIQTQLEPGMLGRAFALIGALGSLPAPLGLMATGFIADSIGVSNAFAIAGILFVIIGGLSFFVPALMALEKPEKSPAR